MNTPQKIVSSLVVLALLALFLSVACSTDAPSIERMTLLIRMIDSQDLWFREEMKRFEEEHGVELNIVSYDKISAVESILLLEKNAGIKRIGLVKTQKRMVVPLASSGLIMPLSEIVSKEQLEQDLSEYLGIALEIGKYTAPGETEGSYHYLPRKLETNTLLFLRSKVREAVGNWRSFRQEINELFRAHNGFGLPRDYELEGEPAQWDWYDLGVVSYYWARTPYDGVLRARTAHRGRIYAGTMTDIATKIFQAGGDSRALLFKGDKIEAVYDAFEWEAFFRSNGLYNPRMWEERYTGEDIWSAMAKGEVFLAFMHQLDAFFVHGTDVMRGYLDDSGDMATAIMPKGVSLELDANGRPVREGTHASNLSGWWWGIPTTSPDPKLSYELARYITSPEFHAAEVSAFGMMPILKELTENLNRYIPEQWMLDVFKTADEQLEAGVQEIPAVGSWPSIERQWLTAWDQVVVKGDYGADNTVDREHIKKVLVPYAEGIRLLAGE